MHWLAPLALLALPLAVAAALWPRAVSRGVRAWRALAVAAVVLVLAHPVRDVRGTRATHVLVLDRSASVPAPDGLDAAAAEFLAGLPRRDRALVVDVGPAAALDPDGSRGHVALADASDLGTALAAAAAAIPVGEAGSVTLVSDGRATARSWARPVQALERRGIPVHTIARPSDPADLALVGWRPVGEWRVGRECRALVQVTGSGVADVALEDEQGEVARAQGVALVAGETTAVELAFEPRAAGFPRLTAVASGADARPGNERYARTVAVQDPLQVLYVGGRTREGAARLSELVGPGFALREQAPTAAAVRDAALVVLDDAPAAALGADVQEAVALAVRDRGLGLFMAGGAAFGPGGWQAEPLAEVLPVESLQEEEKRDPSTTLVVIIDTSGSMGGERVQLAKEVARLAIQRLLPHDKVGIVEFYGAKRWAAPIQPASNRIELERALNRLDAGGGTVILPAIEEAFYGMKNVQTRFKHVLVLTDGGVESGAFEPLLRRMAEDGINVSTVLIGPDSHSEFLVTLANWGKGRFYAVPNRFSLPEILLKQPTSAKLSAYRAGDHPLVARGGDGWWGAVDAAALPPLAGYVETRSRPGAEVLVETERGAHPILASWRYGLGRATALTTEPAGEGSRPWSEWGDYGAWLARVLARTADDARTPYRVALLRAGRTVEVVARRRAADAPPAHLVHLGDGGARPVALLERAPGEWRAELACDPTAEARFELAVDGLSGALRLVSDPVDGAAPERQVAPEDALDLAALAAATGGRALAPGELAAFRPPTGGARAPRDLRDLRPWCAALALLAFLVHLALRRTSRVRPAS